MQFFNVFFFFEKLPGDFFWRGSGFTSSTRDFFFFGGGGGVIFACTETSPLL